MDKTELVNLLQNLKNSKMQGGKNPSGMPLNPSGMPFNPSGMPVDPSGQVFKTGKIACAVIPLIIVLIIGALVGNFFYGDKLFPNSLHGHVVDLVYIPGKTNENRLWIKTDDSFYYTNRTETPGSLSISTESLFNKTYNYIYDPVAKNIIFKNRTDFPSTPPKSRLSYYNGKIWEINPDNDNNVASINTYDPETGQKTMDTEAFTAKWPDIKSGIAKLTVLYHPDRLSITANDGRTALYVLADDKMYKDQSEYNRALEAQSGNMTVFALGSNDTRKELYKVTGPISILSGENMTSLSFSDPESIKSFYDSVATPLTPDKVYLDGYILYSDTDYVLIIHQSSAGNDAERLLTCVDAEGKTLWTLTQDKLLPEMRYSSSDSFSEIFFMKDDFSGQRANDLFLFKMREVGVMGIELPTGTVKWTFRQ